MKCPRCGSEHVNVSIEQVSSKTKIRIMGCLCGLLWGLCRLTLIIFSCGLWLLEGERKGTSKTKFKNKKVAICQECGHSWNI